MKLIDSQKIYKVKLKHKDSAKTLGIIYEKYLNLIYNRYYQAYIPEEYSKSYIILGDDKCYHSVPMNIFITIEQDRELKLNRICM